MDGREIALPATEFALVVHMARQPGRVFTRAQLLDAVHGVAVESYERAIDAHVKNIRRKIEPDPRAPRHLQTVFGVGYRLPPRAGPAAALRGGGAAPRGCAAPAGRHHGGRRASHGRRATGRNGGGTESGRR